MNASQNAQPVNKTVFPPAVSIGMYIAAIALSFVDLLFLNEVIGRVLNIDSIWSLLTSFGLGLVGIAIMTSYGIQLAHGHKSAWSTLGHYALWILLGVTFVVIRLGSAGILELSAAAGDEGLISVFGHTVRTVDLIMAPLMLLLYIATGIMAKDAAKNLLLSPDFHAWMDKVKNARLTRKSKEQKAREKAAADMLKKQEKAAQDLEDARLKALDSKAQLALVKTYGQALNNYNQKLEEIKAKYQQIAANIDYLATIDKQERQFEISIKPNLQAIIQGSIEATQNSVALAVRAKNGRGDGQDLYDTIDAHNAGRTRGA